MTAAPRRYPPLVPPGPELSPDEVARYARQLLVPGLGVEGQRRLRAASVLVVGAGGLGSPALLYLAAAGVGRIGVVDADVVELSNLQRQVVHRDADVGRSKVASAVATVGAIDPGVEVVGHELRLDGSNVDALVEAYDLVLDGTDNFPTRYLLDDACVRVGRPYVWGSILRTDGQVSVFWAGAPADGPCYRCLWPAPPPAGAVPSCAEAGVLGVLCGVVGSTMAAEAIKVITGMGAPLVGRLLLHDAHAGTYREVTITKDPACPGCGPVRAAPGGRGRIDADRQASAPDEELTMTADAGDPVERATIDVLELKARMDRGDDFLLVDVREQMEADIVQIDERATLMPMQTFEDGTALAALPRDRDLVLHCRSGGRSARALAILQANGYDRAVHVRGGVIDWVRQVEPDKPTY